MASSLGVPDRMAVEGPAAMGYTVQGGSSNWSEVSEGCDMWSHVRMTVKFAVSESGLVVDRLQDYMVGGPAFVGLHSLRSDYCCMKFGYMGYLVLAVRMYEQNFEDCSLL